MHQTWEGAHPSLPVVLPESDRDGKGRAVQGLVAMVGEGMEERWETLRQPMKARS